MSALSEFQERYRRSVAAFIQGDPEPQKAMWSQRDDVTLANPLGPPVRGPAAVYDAMDGAASQLRDGEGLTVETISEWETPDMAYLVGIERCRIRLGTALEKIPVALRVTTIFFREDGGWKLVHRHADPLMETRSLDALVRPSPLQ
jgi:ketosteroid isomerase-like protein